MREPDLNGGECSMCGELRIGFRGMAESDTGLTKHQPSRSMCNCPDWDANLDRQSVGSVLDMAYERASGHHFRNPLERVEIVGERLRVS